MQSKNKLNTVWVCSFANAEVAKNLNVQSSLSISPWITELIELFRDHEDINLTILSPNYYTNKNETVKLGNITICLFKYRPNYLPKKAYNLAFTYSSTKKNVFHFIELLKPDIIHLHGSENPLYAAGIVKYFEKYPILVTIQGFVSMSQKPKQPLSRFIRWNRVRYETIINTKTDYFSVGSKVSSEYVRRINKKAKIYEAYYPTTVPACTSDDCEVKKYDIVYYARITKDKGIEDVLQAVKTLKNVHPEIKTIIIGGGNAQYVEFIKQQIKVLDLEANITFAGFQKTQQDVFRLAIQAKVYVLPTYFDEMPGSMREAMFMKLPVVSYAVGGIPSLNNNAECVTLAEKGNIAQLVEKIDLILRNSERTEKVVKNAYELITSKFDNNKIYSNYLSIYNDMLSIENKKNDTTP